MAKKNFNLATDRVLNKEQQTPERPTDNKPKRTTLYVIPNKYERIKDIAYWDRTTVTEITDQAFSEFIEKYEKKNGKIDPRPEGK